MPKSISEVICDDVRLQTMHEGAVEIALAKILLRLPKVAERSKSCRTWENSDDTLDALILAIDLLSDDEVVSKIIIEQEVCDIVIDEEKSPMTEVEKAWATPGLVGSSGGGGGDGEPS
jgi:hypothetical protein